MKVVVSIIFVLLLGGSGFTAAYEERKNLEHELDRVGMTQRLKIFPHNKDYWVLLFPNYIGVSTFVQIYSVTSEPESDLITVSLDTDVGNATVVMGHVAGDIISTTFTPPAQVAHEVIQGSLGLIQ